MRVSAIASRARAFGVSKGGGWGRADNCIELKGWWWPTANQYNWTRRGRTQC